MLEIPEAAVLTRQVNETVKSKIVEDVIVGKSPHSFAWFSGEPEFYKQVLVNKQVDEAVNFGGLIEIHFGDKRLLFSDGINLRYHASLDDEPSKHQLLLIFSDDSCISASVAMYGGLACYHVGEYDNPYYKVALEKPVSLSKDFDVDYFLSLFTPEMQKKSMKAFLATEQRIPGLGNGVLQDILYLSGLHPKRKVNTLSSDDVVSLHGVIKNTLQKMIDQGGRDTERDLFGRPGKYQTMMSKNTVGKPCTQCGTEIQKQSYMGGSIYYCSQCQPLE